MSAVLAQEQRERVIKRFMAKVSKATNGCWLWTAAKDKDGYGSFQYGGLDGMERSRKERAHRVAMMLFSSADIDGAVICHKCDNPACVNPEHLFIGDSLANVHDRVKKGRSAKGDAHGRRTKPDSFERGADKRRKRFLFNGRQMTLREISKETGANFASLKNRIGRGWSIERALSEPAFNRGQFAGTSVSVVILVAEAA